MTTSSVGLDDRARPAPDPRDPLARLRFLAPFDRQLRAPESARTQLDELKGWLGVHNTAVIAVLFLVFGVVLISKGLAPLSS